MNESLPEGPYDANLLRQHLPHVLAPEENKELFARMRRLPACPVACSF